jgi:HemY protein
VLLTQAELQLDQGQYEQALATLRRLEEKAPNHSYALNLLGRLYYRLEDWAQLEALMPRLKKHGRVDDDLLGKWAIRVHRENLGRAADADAVLNAWNSVPKNLRTDTSLLEAYFAALIRTEQHDKAEKEIAAELKREWRPPLVRLFGMITSSDPAKQLIRAEGWLKAHPDDPDLLLAAARLCLRNELWGKARSYLETAISIRPSPETYEEYGRLLNQLGEGDAAADAYKTGLGIVAGTPLRAIPDLRARSGVS